MEFRNITVSFFAGLLGAAAFHLCLSLAKPGEASGPPLTSTSAGHEAGPANGATTLTTRQLNVVDAQGKLRMQIGMAKQGPPGIWLMDDRGVARGIFGLYEDGTAYMGLQDAQGQMIQLMRSFGGHETPLLIFKNQGQDRMIMGLNPANGREAFTMFYNDQGQRQNQFGRYEGP